MAQATFSTFGLTLSLRTRQRKLYRDGYGYRSALKKSARDEAPYSGYPAY